MISLISFKLFDRYGRKIWLTEFAVANTHDKQKVIDFVKVSLSVGAFSCLEV